MKKPNADHPVKSAEPPLFEIVPDPRGEGISRKAIEDARKALEEFEADQDKFFERITKG